MIIVNLSGGLGNQMFQYAFGRALALRYGLQMKLDANYYSSEKCKNSDVPRSYMLGSYNIKAELATQAEVARLNTFFVKVIRKLKYKIFGPQKASLFDKKAYSRQDEHYYVGFWQNEKYFLDYADEIRKDFTINGPMTPSAQRLSKMIDAEQYSLSIHIRRGDNASNPPSMVSFGCPGLEYYDPALKVVTDKLGNDAPIKLFVFSDDVEWVRQNLKTNLPMIFVSDSGVTTQEEIVLMSKCKHNIISNSTFSWWGAWLNEYKSKIVVAPIKWTLVDIENYKEIMPSDWIRV